MSTSTPVADAPRTPTPPSPEPQPAPPVASSSPTLSGAVADAPTLPPRPGPADPTLPPPGAPPAPTIPITAQTELGKGSTLGVYQIERQLGQGGMGAVYKAVHTHLGKTVALKVLVPKLTESADAAARFRREMKAVGQLDHPNIVRATDAGEVGGVHFLAMEYLEGTDLSEWVKKKGPMSVVNACRALQAAAQGLKVAHAAGRVHRDVKPSNLFRTTTGQIKVLDLGLALIATEAEKTTELTAANQAFGTPDYIAPEQCEDAHAVDARCDLYALGCTLYFLLVGKAPFDDPRRVSFIQKITAHVTAPPPDLKAQRPDVPDGLVAVYLRLMEKRPADRYQTAAELIEALTPFANPKATPASEPPTVPTQPTAPPRPMAAPLPDFPTFETPQPAATGRTKKPAPKRATSATANGGNSKVPPARFRWKPHRLIAAGLAGVVLLAGIVIKIKNKDGSTTTIDVSEGASVDVSRDGEPVATIPAEKPPPNGPPLPSQPPKPGKESVFDINRRAAEAILALNGTVRVHTIAPFRDETVTPDGKLPEEPFVIRQIEMRKSPDVTDADLDPLVGLRHVWEFNVQHTRLTSAAIDRINTLPGLKSLTIDRGIPTSHWGWLKPQPGVHTLWVVADQVDDDWKFLEKFPALRTLVVTYVGKPGADLRPLAKWTHLRNLRLSSFAAPPPPEVAAELQKANPKLRILWDNGRANARMLGHDPAAEAAQKFLARGAEFAVNKAFANERLTIAQPPWPDGAYIYISILKIPTMLQLSADDQTLITHFTVFQLVAEGQQNADELARHLAEHQQIRGLTLDQSDLSDVGLARLARLEGLHHLVVRGTKVTADGIARFRRANPDCRIASDHGDIWPDYEMVPDPNAFAPVPAAGKESVFDVNRRAAEWVLSKKGSVTLMLASLRDQPIVTDAANLPNEPFVVRDVRMHAIQDLRSADLDHLTGLRHLRGWNVSCEGVDIGVVDRINRIPSLRELVLARPSLKTSQWTGLHTQPDVDHLYVTSPQIDDNWSFLDKFPSLSTLSVENYSANDLLPDLGRLAEYPQLRRLHLARFARPASDVIERLQAKNPHLEIQWVSTDLKELAYLGQHPALESAKKMLERGVQFSAYEMPSNKPFLIKSPPWPEGRWWRSINILQVPRGVQLTDEERGWLTRFYSNQFNAPGQRDADGLAKILATQRGLTIVDLSDSDLTDAGLRELRKIAGLYGLELTKTRVTAAGIQAFRRSNPACSLRSDFGHLLPDYEAVPVRPEESAAPK